MGLLTAAGSVGRIVFPLLAGLLYSAQSLNLALMLPALLAMFAVFALGLGMRTWQSWRQWIDQMRHGSPVPEVSEEEDEEGQLEEEWLTIDQMMERIHHRAQEKQKLNRLWIWRAGQAGQSTKRSRVLAEGTREDPRH